MIFFIINCLYYNLPEISGLKGTQKYNDIFNKKEKQREN